MSETAKWRHLTAPYCQGTGLDLGSGGDPVVPWAISVDLPREEAEAYTTTEWGGPIHLRRDVFAGLPWFKDGALDFVYASHVLEDAHPDGRGSILEEWRRVIKTGGYLAILVPEVSLWAQAVEAGQPMNHNHAAEFRVGELTALFERVDGWEVVEDRIADPEALTAVGTPDYSILFVARKTQ